jgi:uncharacterized protein DUF1116
MSIDAANKAAGDRILGALPFLERVRPALDVLPGMKPNKILHAGPPAAWSALPDPVRGGILATARFEGLAADEDEADALIRRGQIEIGPCHEHAAVGPATGIISASTPVLVVRNQTAGNVAASYVRQGFGRTLTFGAYDDAVVERVRWLWEEMAPALDRGLQVGGPVDLRSLIAEALLRGDELHNRNKAATSMLLEEMAIRMLKADVARPTLLGTMEALHEDFQFFVSLSMAASKAATDAGHDVSGSSVVTAMSRNGAEFGIRVSGLGDEWFTGPAQMVKGLYFPGFSATDAAPDLGDSAITETAGLGAFTLVGSPAILQLIGGGAEQAREYTLQMYEITLDEHPFYRLPALDFRGSPALIDFRRVVRTGILPIIDTSITHRKAGVGMIGAGLVNPPMECFTKALEAFAARYGKSRA